MSKFRLTALSEDRAQLMGALQKTQLVELTFSSSEGEEGAVLHTAGIAALSEKLARVNRCIEFLRAQADGVPDKKAIRGQMSDQILLDYDDFAAAAKEEARLMEIVARMETLAEALALRKAERNKLAASKSQIAPYAAVPERFSDLADTRNTICFFGLIDEGAVPALQEYAGQEPLAALTLYTGGKQVPVSLFVHRSVGEAAAEKLSELGFARCGFRFEATAAEEMQRLDAETARLLEEERAFSEEAQKEIPALKDLKVFADYLSTETEKAEDYERFFKTKATFTMDGYAPKDDIGRVQEAVAAVTDAYLLDFSDPEETDTPPTLLKNKGPAKTAEFITNMYSAPDYREFDPNGFVFVFFMIFFGIIMADMGYGLLLFLGGLILTRRRKVNDGMKKLCAIMTYGGIFTAAFGALFGSMFGAALYPSILPDPSSGSRTDVLTILLGCLALGLLQITVGYVLSAVNSLRRGHVADAICDAFSWVLFCIGLFFAVFNFLTEYFGIPVSAGVHAFFETMTLPGVVMLGVGLAVAALTAGRKEKLLGKFTKGFGAVYGIINLLSDVLSYARLFGLMLSGMIIGQQFNGIGLDLIAAGGVGFVFGPVVMVIGHAFNLAMGVLGAYIHDCRLQYIEFFSKFYTGEGALFTPLGSRRQYVYFKE